MSNIGHVKMNALKKIQGRLDDREPYYNEIEAVRKSLMSIKPSTPVEDAQDQLADAVARLRHVADKSLYGEDKDTMNEAADLLERTEEAMKERERDALIAALCSVPVDDDDDIKRSEKINVSFADMLLEIKKNLRRAQQLPKKTFESKAPTVSLKKGERSDFKAPESGIPNVSLKKVHRSKERDFLERARNNLKSVKMKSEDAHCIVTMMVNLKKANNDPSVRDHCIIKASQDLSEDCFDAISDTIDEYCNISSLSDAGREEFVDMIFDRVTEDDDPVDSNQYSAIDDHALLSTDDGELADEKVGAKPVQELLVKEMASPFQSVQLKKATPLEKSTASRKFPVVDLKKTQANQSSMPESQAPADVNLKKSQGKDGDNFLKKAKKCLRSIQLKPEEAHALATMMVNLKRAGDYQNRPDICDKEHVHLSHALEKPTFDALSGLLEDYCKVHLSDENRDEFVDIIFDRVVYQENHAEENNVTESDSNCSTDDEETIEEDNEYGVDGSDWLQSIEEETAASEAEAAGVSDNEKYETASSDNESLGTESETPSERRRTGRDSIGNLEKLIYSSYTAGSRNSPQSSPKPPPAPIELQKSVELSPRTKIGITRKHKWTNGRFRNTIVNTKRWRESETFGVDKALYSPLSNEQLGRRKKVSDALLRVMDSQVAGGPQTATGIVLDHEHHAGDSSSESEDEPAVKTSARPRPVATKRPTKVSSHSRSSIGLGALNAGDGGESFKDEQDAFKLLTCGNARSSIIVLDTPSSPVPLSPLHSPKGRKTSSSHGKSYVVRDSIVGMADALSKIEQDDELNKLLDF